MQNEFISKHCIAQLTVRLYPRMCVIETLVDPISAAVFNITRAILHSDRLNVEIVGRLLVPANNESVVHLCGIDLRGSASECRFEIDAIKTWCFHANENQVGIRL